MPGNRVPPQKGVSDDTFERLDPDEEACRKGWFARRWPEGFKCPRCAAAAYCGIRDRQLLQCRCCRYQSSATTANGFAALPSSRASSISATSPAPIEPPRAIPLSAGPTACSPISKTACSPPTGWSAPSICRAASAPSPGAPTDAFVLKSILQRLAIAATTTPPMPDRLLKLAEARW